MTEREGFLISESKEFVLTRDLWMCRFSGCHKRAIFVAHGIAKSKANIKKYGLKVIHDPLNLWSVCEIPEHNDSFNIGNNPGKVAELLSDIEEAQ